MLLHSVIFKQNVIMKRLIWFCFLSMCFNQIVFSQTKKIIEVATTKEPVAGGKFKPAWQSLQQYKVPEWYRNAKFGIWAHWGPQCQAEMGDWYGRGMYEQGGWQYNSHVFISNHSSIQK